MRVFLLTVGWISLGLGAIGLFVPVLPTTPFVLLSAACFLRSSERLHTWLIEHPTFGSHIADYLAGKGLTRKTKVVALTTLWLSVGISVYFFVPHAVADVIIVVIAAAVTVYILRLPTCTDASCDTGDGETPENQDA
jgi:uncharacterized membrane protein YbaN (DUF454 family)